MASLSFGGGSEFAAISLWNSPPHVLLIVAITFLVYSLHLLMGAALAPHLRHLPRRIGYLALLLMYGDSLALSSSRLRRRSRSNWADERQGDLTLGNAYGNVDPIRIGVINEASDSIFHCLGWLTPPRQEQNPRDERIFRKQTRSTFLFDLHHCSSVYGVK